MSLRHTRKLACNMNQCIKKPVSLKSNNNSNNNITTTTRATGPRSMSLRNFPHPTPTKTASRRGFSRLFPLPLRARSVARQQSSCAQQTLARSGSKKGQEDNQSHQPPLQEDECHEDQPPHEESDQSFALLSEPDHELCLSRCSSLPFPFSGT